MDFVDNEVAKDTGTIQGRAVFNNTGHIIEPGMFGRARLLGSGEYEAIMVPDEVIGSDQSRKFVYVVNSDGVVSSRTVQLGPLYKKKFRVIREGLYPQSVVVTGNIQKVRDGSGVIPQMVDLTDQETNPDADQQTDKQAPSVD
jgi:hypothetical protein